MYRGLRGTEEFVTTYCDAHQVVPNLGNVVGPAVRSDDQIRLLDKYLPCSVLPCALALACFACESRWPAVPRSDGHIFGSGAQMPDWVVRVRCGQRRFGGRSVVLDDVMSTPGTVVLRTLDERRAWVAHASPDTPGLGLATMSLDDNWVVRGDVSRLPLALPVPTSCRSFCLFVGSRCLVP